MHRCFRVPEILSIIIDGLADFERRADIPFKRAQALVARTCKLFHEPAMNAVWSSLGDLEPLIRCLPSETWKKDEASGHVIMVRGPVGEEWALFLINAARVKSLDIAQAIRLKDYLRTMRMYLPSLSPPFPNLQSLAFNCRISLNAAVYIPVLLNSKLQKFSLSLNDGDVVSSVLGFLSSQCPEVHSLSLANWDEHALAALPRFEKLQSLGYRVPMSTPITVSFLATSTFLTTLSIRSPCTMSVIPNIVASSDTFPHLADLNVYDIQDVLVINALLRLVPYQKLFWLCLAFDPSKPLSNMDNMNTLVETVSNLHSLAQLMIIRPHLARGGAPRWDCQWDLGPLRRLSFLQHLGISLPGYEWSRELLRHVFGTAWPKLEVLSLADCTSLSSIEILGDCALYLPNLLFLSIPIDATIYPEHPVPTARSMEPIRLSLEQCPISDNSWPYIAAYIAAVYPQAEIETPEAETDDEDEKRWWHKVARMVPIMAMVGQTERSLIHDGTIPVEPVFQAQTTAA